MAPVHLGCFVTRGKSAFEPLPNLPLSLLHDVRQAWSTYAKECLCRVVACFSTMPHAYFESTLVTRVWLRVGVKSSTPMLGVGTKTMLPPLLPSSPLSFHCRGGHRGSGGVHTRLPALWGARVGRSPPPPVPAAPEHGEGPGPAGEAMACPPWLGTQP